VPGNPHGHLVGVLVGDPLVHLEEVPVPLAQLVLAQPPDGVLEVEVHPASVRADAAPVVALLLHRPGGDVARGEVPVARILALEEVVAVFLGDGFRRLPDVLPLPGDPASTVVAERFGHEGQLRLVLARLRDAGGVDLGVAGVGEEGALLVGLPDGRDAAPHGVGGEVEHVDVPARAQQDRVAHVAADLPRDQVAQRDPLGLAVDHHEVEHLGAGVHLHRARADLAREGGVGPEEELLAGLPAGVEGPGDLRAAERAGLQVAAVVARERDALRHALVDDVVAHLGQPPDVGLARPEVAALDGVVEEAEDAVAVVRVVLRRVDPALGRDAMGAPGAVLVAERLDVVPQLAEGRGGGGAGQAGADDEDPVLPLVRRVHQLHVGAVALPRRFDRAGRRFAVEDHAASLIPRRRRRRRGQARG
jgi:hypothetical protein